MAYKKKPSGPNALLLQVVYDLEAEAPGEWGPVRWKRCYKSLQDHPEVIRSKEDLLPLKYWQDKSIAQVWRIYTRSGPGSDDAEDDGPGPSRRKKASPTKSKAKKKTGRQPKNTAPDFDFGSDEGGEDFSETFGLQAPRRTATAAPPARSAHESMYNHAPAAPFNASTSSQPQASSASVTSSQDPTDLKGFQFWYLDDKDAHVRSSDNAYISIPNLLFKIKFQSSQILNPWARKYVQNVKSVTSGISYGYVSQLIGETITQCPGFTNTATATPAASSSQASSSQASSSQASSSQPPARVVPKQIAPVPLAQRQSSGGGPSNASLQAEMARQNKKRAQQSLDPTRSSQAVMDALEGVNIKVAPRPTAIGSFASAAALREERATSSVHASSSVFGSSPAPPTPLARTRTAPAAIPYPSVPTTAKRRAPRVSAHIPAPRPTDEMEREIHQASQSSRFEPSSSQAEAELDGDVDMDIDDQGIYSGSVDEDKYKEPFVPHILKAGEYDIRLILDIRENRAKNQDVVSELVRRRVPVEMRPLSVGDIAWVATKRRADGLGGPQECVLDVVIERKRTDDLVDSIKSGRFHEQKFRLKESGIGTVIFLIEHYHTAKYRDNDTTAQMLDTALSSTSVVDGFFVKEARSDKDVPAYLAQLHRTIVEKHRGCDLHIIPSTHIRRYSYTKLQQYLRQTQQERTFLTTWDAFQLLNAKSAHITLRDAWARMLLCINGLSPEKVSAIIEIYDTPRALWESFKEAEEIEREGRAREEMGVGKGKGRAKKSAVPLAKHLLTRLPALGRRKIGPTLSEKVYEQFRADVYDR